MYERFSRMNHAISEDGRTVVTTHAVNGITYVNVHRMNLETGMSKRVQVTVIQPDGTFETMPVTPEMGR